MKGITSEIWGRMKEGLQVKESFAGAIAFRSGDLVLWRSNHKELSAMQMFELDWKLVEEEEKEIETEKWIREDCHSDIILYRSCRSNEIFNPASVTVHRSFLRWGGAMPDDEEDWPAYSWVIWINGEGSWRSDYDPKDGYTKQIFADYAEMRVEK